MPIYINGQKYIGAYKNGQKINGYYNGIKLFNYTAQLQISIYSAINSSLLMSKTMIVPCGTYTLDELQPYGFNTTFDQDLGYPSVNVDGNTTETYTTPLDAYNSDTWPGRLFTCNASFPINDVDNNGNDIGIGWFRVAPAITIDCSIYNTPDNKTNVDFKTPCYAEPWTSSENNPLTSQVQTLCYSCPGVRFFFDQVYIDTTQQTWVHLSGTCGFADNDEATLEYDSCTQGWIQIEQTQFSDAIGYIPQTSSMTKTNLAAQNSNN